MAKENFEGYKETLVKMGFEIFTIASVMSTQTKGQDIKNALMFRTAEPVQQAIAVKDGVLFLMQIKDKGFFKPKLMIPQANIEAAIQINRKDVVLAKRIKAKRPYNSYCSKFDHIQMQTATGIYLNFYLFGQNDDEIFACFSKLGIAIE